MRAIPHIRPFEHSDYDAIVRVHNLARPRDVTTAARIKDWDENRPAHLKASRWVAEVGSRVVAVGEYSQSPDLYHPRKFQILVYVHPDEQGRGVGSALYDFVAEQLRPFDPIAYQARSHADQERTLAFLARRGFREDFRMWDSYLDVEAFDFAPWTGAEERVRRNGVRIATLPELAGDPDRDRRIFDLECETMRDIPSPPSVTSTGEDLSPEELEQRFARYVRRALNHPDRPPDAFFVAVKDGEYVGLTYFEVDREHARAEILMTGVKGEYRGQGVGTALKLAGVRWAREHGFRTIVTGNDTVNAPILAINDSLGFVRQPELIFFEKDLGSSCSLRGDSAP